LRDGFTTRIHRSVVAAVHVQLSSAETLTANLPPPASMRVSDRSSVNRQGEASCVTVRRRSLTTIVPERALGCWFAAAVSVTSSSPWPDAGATRIHDASLDTLHEHSRAAATTAVTLPPAAGNADAGPVRFV
jgi:hypothetical protein